MLPGCPHRGDKSHFPYRDHLKAGLYKLQPFLNSPPFSFSSQFHTTLRSRQQLGPMCTSVQNDGIPEWESAATFIIHHSTTSRFDYSTIGYPNAGTSRI